MVITRWNYSMAARYDLLKFGIMPKQFEFGIRRQIRQVHVFCFCRSSQVLQSQGLILYMDVQGCQGKESKAVVSIKIQSLVEPLLRFAHPILLDANLSKRGQIIG